jgi:hypothetical protein
MLSAGPLKDIKKQVKQLVDPVGDAKGVGVGKANDPAI